MWQSLQELSHKKVSQSSDDNMIPLINIVFLLLIFFMVAGQIKAQQDASIRLPESKKLETAQMVSMHLELLRDGQIQLNGELIQAAQLKTAFPVNQATSIALFADGRATAKQLDTLISAIPSSTNIQLRLFTMEAQ
ncbi:biopolymer transporter ExbD [Oceaniserpentilla sp. 4NH20-0058]|uniref:ExbD/TolR family protein n=1 Tax=Oceaniserpentilla sp. 4NH20-0058 TaxID=3127660 RepID=UPI00333E20B8